MSVDESLVRAINGFAGQSDWIDGLALALSNPGLLWVPGILLACYWMWVSWREALLGAPVLAASIGLLDFVGARIKDLAARRRPQFRYSPLPHTVSPSTVPPDQPAGAPELAV